MGSLLTDELSVLLADRATTTVLATIDENGFPHAVAGVPLHTSDTGTLLYPEYFESSATNKNLTRSIWFDGVVSIALSNAGKSFQIKGRPIKSHITGPLFFKFYEGIRATEGNVNLAAVWEIEPIEIIDESLATRRKYEETKRPFFTHLDRIVR